MLRNAWKRAKYHGTRALGHALVVAQHVDRALGHAEHWYKHVGPVALGLAREHGYGDLADQIHHNATTIFNARGHGRLVGNAIREAREVK